MFFKSRLRHKLATETLEGVAISVSVRWMIALAISLFLGFLALGLANQHDPDRKLLAASDHYIVVALLLFLAIMISDLVTIRRSIKTWTPERIHSMGIIGNFPLLLVVLIPLYLLLFREKSMSETIDWAGGMLWVFSVFGVGFYLVYFALLLFAFRLPRWQALVGFALSCFGSVWGYHQVKSNQEPAKLEAPESISSPASNSESPEDQE